MKKQDLIILSVILFGLVLIRVFFNIPNFNPLGAVALMGGLFIGKKSWTYLLPLGALFLGDAILALSSPTYAEYLFSTSFLFVYGAFALIIALGMLLAKNPSLLTVLAGSFGAAILFFLFTNAGSWLAYDMYSKDFAGLLASYEAGIPFFRNTLISQVLFSVIIYVVYSVVTSRRLALAK